jgi:protein-tyrosine phosphatase
MKQNHGPGDAATADVDVPLAGAPNFRAVAPLRAAQGRRLRARRLFRSDALHRLTDDDVARLEPLAIDTVLDLRRADERSTMPSRWPTRRVPRTLTFDAPPGLEAVQAGGWLPHLADPSFGPEAAHRWMVETYARMPRALAPAVRAAIGRAGDPQAVLVHCTAGKDRTGFVCAMVLEALGAPREAIVDDYLESSRRRPPETLAAALIAWSGTRPSARERAAIETIASVQPAFLEAAYREVERGWGSVAAYLAHCGLDDRTREALHAALLE